MTRFLAWICSICPVCLFGRAKPNSRFVKGLEKYQKYCPACRAYKKLHGEKQP
jgi:hypothetical protein